MNIKNIYEIIIDDAKKRNPRTGYSRKQSNQIEQWSTIIAGLAAFLGWDHEINTDDCSDEYEFDLAKIKEKTPDQHECTKYTHAYEITGIIIEDRHVPFGQI